MRRISDVLARLRDWVSLTASVRRLERDARDVLQEATLTLEKMNTLAARLARRDAKTLRAALSAPQEHDQPVARVVGAPHSGKSAVRARIAERAGIRRPFGVPPASPAERPCEGCEEPDDNPPAGV